MNKSQIADGLAGRMGLSKSEAVGAVDAVFETIAEALIEEEDVSKRSARMSISPCICSVTAGWTPASARSWSATIAISPKRCVS